jgi:peptide-methionine (S)-S-oxide reductase
MTKHKKVAEKLKKELEVERVYKDHIVTEISPFKSFYVAEDYHKNYYEEHQRVPYCSYVIDQKSINCFSSTGIT